MPRGGRGSENGTAFITVSEDCTLRGVTVYYPDQVVDAAPQPYPWTITLAGNNAAVTDVELLNVWNGIQAVMAARHYIARVQGQPANIGIFVGACGTGSRGRRVFPVVHARARAHACRPDV